MVRLIGIILCLVVLAGCAVVPYDHYGRSPYYSRYNNYPAYPANYYEPYAHSDYYANPDSPGYKEAVFPVKCPSCKGELYVSSEQINGINYGVCPYCEHEFNIRVARDRYIGRSGYLQTPQQGPVVR